MTLNLFTSHYEDILSSYAQKSSESRGRKHSELPHPFRNPYQRDRDRIVHCRAFRRLEYKTQVLVNHLGDHYRTRLTHTIEVSLISRCIARALNVHEDLTEAIAMAHDLGHPPFGHAGEKILNKLMQADEGFEHNLQSLRIVDKLENRYPQFHGLNLNYEVRLGLIKHQNPKAKPDFLLKEGYHLNGMPILEAQIVDLADEIAYSCHDLEDSWSHGYLQAASIRNLQIWHHTETSKLFARKSLSEEVVLYHLIRSLIDLLVRDLVRNTKNNLEKYHIKTLNDVISMKRPLVGFSSEIQIVFKELQKFLRLNFYQHQEVKEMVKMAENVLTTLFNFYLENSKELPKTTYKKLKDRSLKRVICDYMAGMTDRFALEEYNKRNSK